MKNLRALCLLLSCSVVFAIACGSSSKTNSTLNGSPTGTNGGTSGGTSGAPGSPGSGTPSVGTQFVYTADITSFNISGYKINNDGSLAAIPGTPVLVQSQAPFLFTPTAITQAGKYLLSESMSPNTPSGIESYAINPVSGVLTLVSTAQTPLPQNSFFASGGALIADQAKMVGYATGQVAIPIPNGSTSSMAVGSFQVNADGTLSPIGTPVQLLSAGGLALDPGGRFLYTAGQHTLAAITRNPDGSLGSLAPGSPIQLQGAAPTQQTEPCWIASQSSIAVSSTGKFLYVACGGSISLNVVSVNADGTMSVVQAVPPTGPAMEFSSVALNPAGNLLVATEEAANSVVVFSVDSSTGKLSQLGVAPAGTNPNSVAFDKTGTYVYVTNGSSVVEKGNEVLGSNNVSAFAVGANGTLIPVPGSPFASGGSPRSIVVVQP